MSTGEVIYSSDAGQTWHLSNLVGASATALGLDPRLPNQRYASVYDAEGIWFMRSTDFGATWERVSAFPDAKPGDMAALAVLPGSPDRIVASGHGRFLVSSDGGATGARLTTVPADPYKLLVQRWPGGARLFCATLGSDAGVWWTDDLETWHKLLDGRYRLSLSSDGQAVAAYYERDPDREGPTTAVLVITPSGIESYAIDPEFHGGFFAGVLYPPIPHMTFNGFSYEVYEVSEVDGDPEWERSLHSYRLETLAVPPGFPTTSRVVLAAGAEGIFRKLAPDGLWQLVLPDDHRLCRASIAQADGEDPCGEGGIGELLFADGQHVIGVEMGRECLK